VLKGAVRPAATNLPRSVTILWLGLALLLATELLAIATWLDTGTLEQLPGGLRGMPSWQARC